MAVDGKDFPLMQATLAELAALVEGQLIGRGDLVIHGAAPLREAQPGQITLLNGSDKNHNLRRLPGRRRHAPRSYTPNGLPTIHVDDVHQAFTRIVLYFCPPRVRRGSACIPWRPSAPRRSSAEDVDMHPFATIGDDVVIGRGSTIHSGVHIMAGSQIGADVTIFPNAVLYENTVVGPRCVIHAGAVLGAYGFGYGLVDGRHRLSAQLGNVVLGADVEIGAGTTIDRGTYGPTTIGEGTKIDNLVMVAHNCHIGRHNMLCSQVGIAGSTTTGDYVVMAGPGGRPRPRAHRRPGRAGRHGRHHQRRARRQPHDRHSRHARARAEGQAGRLQQAARDAAAVEAVGSHGGEARGPSPRSGSGCCGNVLAASGRRSCSRRSAA